MKIPVAMWVVVLMILGGSFPCEGQDALSQATGSQSTSRLVPASEWEHSHEGPYGEALLRVEKAIRCNCGCNLDVHTCQYQMQCGTSPEWSRRIYQSLEAGEADEAILAGFTADFGPNVLMTLPTEGFNWVAYILPWVALLAGAGVVGMVLRHRGPATIPDLSGPDMTPEGWSRIEDELRRLEEEERTSDF